MSAASSGLLERPATVEADAADFARLMARLGPFEPAPRLAAGVSGGPDSLALCLLAHGWARARGGRVFGLIVDHRLRPGSAGEAAAVAARLTADGIAARVLVRRGPPPATGVQAAARAARHALLSDWCRARGVFHLLLGHHADDQSETLLMRAERGSGPDGLAGMAAAVERRGHRVLRPLLAWPKARLVRHLEARGRGWVEDPSNADPAFRRARLRADRPVPPPALDRERAAADRRTAAWLVRAVLLDPAGFALVARAALAEPAATSGLRHVLTTVGGAAYPPSPAAVARLVAVLGRNDARAVTLHGCLIRPVGETVRVRREPAAVAGRRPLASSDDLLWDGRFRVRYRGPPGLAVGPLGVGGVARLPVRSRLPATVRQTLPCLWRVDRPVAVPHLLLRDPDVPDGPACFSAVFAPVHPLTTAAFQGTRALC